MICKCGHEKIDHIYEDGACRSGKVICPCTAYEPVMDELVFCEATHTYTLKSSGIELPSVTTILKGVGVSNYSFINPDVLLRASKFGSAVHRATELFDQGRLDMDSLDAALVPYLSAWIKFVDDYGFKAEAIEARVYSPTSFFAGTIDRVGAVSKGPLSGKRILADIKTGMILPSVRLQTAGYAIAWDEAHRKDKIKARLCIGLREDGYTVEHLKDPSDVGIFLSCLSVYNFLKNNGGRTNGND